MNQPATMCGGKSERNLVTNADDFLDRTRRSIANALRERLSM